MRKPLEGKAFGSIPHLPGSKRGIGDHGLTKEQCQILVDNTKKLPADSRIIVTEKLDGSCVSVARVQGRLHYLTRSGWPTKDSKYKLHHEFEAWARKQDFEFLGENDRVVGEWLGTAHGTIYHNLTNPFYVFDIFNDVDRYPYNVAVDATVNHGLQWVPILHIGCQISVREALELLGKTGRIDADLAEGVVYRYERDRAKNGMILMWPNVLLAKHVRFEKIAGKYLDDDQRNSIYNWRED